MGYTSKFVLCSVSVRMASKVYCHYNDNEGNTTFRINIFGSDLVMLQDPGSRSLGHGAVVWDSSVVFAKYMEMNTSDFDPVKMSTKRVLELGSGCGLAGIAFMLRGAAVTMTDMVKVTSTLTERNAQTNYLHAKNSDLHSNITIQRPTVHPIDWTHHASEDPTLALPAQIFDIILLTDCVFSVELVPDLMCTILKYTGPKTTVMVCHEVRDQAANDQFLVELSKHFTWKNVSKSKFHPDYMMSADIGHIIIAKPNRPKKEKAERTEKA